MENLLLHITLLVDQESHLFAFCPKNGEAKNVVVKGRGIMKIKLWYCTKIQGNSFYTEKRRKSILNVKFCCPVCNEGGDDFSLSDFLSIRISSKCYLYLSFHAYPIYDHSRHFISTTAVELFIYWGQSTIYTLLYIFIFQGFVFNLPKNKINADVHILNKK